MFWIWAGYWILLFTVMHLPKPPGARLVGHVGDKLVHSIVYFLLGMLGGWAAVRRGRNTDAAWALLWLTVYAVYAAADELLQPLFDRACQFTDWVSDVFGAGLALLLVMLLRRLARRKSTTL